MLMGGPHNTYAVHNKNPPHFFLNFIPAPRKMHLSRGRSSAQNAHCPYCSKSEQSGNSLGQKWESCATPGSTPAAPDDQRFRAIEHDNREVAPQGLCCAAAIVRVQASAARRSVSSR